MKNIKKESSSDIGIVDNDVGTVSNTKHKVSWRALIRLMRPKQWTKNIFIFGPLIFSGAFTDILAIKQALIVFVLFCSASSATYILNDYKDIESDRKHPEKSKKRPLASGEVKPREAFFLMGCLYSVLAVGGTLFPNVGLVILAYLVLNVAYCYYLKHQPILDIFSIAIGFVLRVMAGSVALDVPLSSWMFITTLSLALYLAAIKRRQELLNVKDKTRDVLQYYSVDLVDKYAQISAICALLFYSLFVISSKEDMVISIPFVIFGIFRYWFVVEKYGDGESPTNALLADKQLIFVIVAWISVSLYTLWPS